MVQGASVLKILWWENGCCEQNLVLWKASAEHLVMSGCACFGSRASSNSCLPFSQRWNTDHKVTVEPMTNLPKSSVLQASDADDELEQTVLHSSADLWSVTPPPPTKVSPTCMDVTPPPQRCTAAAKYMYLGLRGKISWFIFSKLKTWKKIFGCGCPNTAIYLADIFSWRLPELKCSNKSAIRIHSICLYALILCAWLGDHFFGTALL